MKEAIKIAMPTVLAIVLGWIAVQAIQSGMTKYKAQKLAKQQRLAAAIRRAQAQPQEEANAQ